MPNIVKYGLAAVGGFTAAIIFDATRTISGTLKVDITDPDKDLFSIEIDDLDKIKKKKRILLKVETSHD